MPYRPSLFKKNIGFGVSFSFSTYMKYLAYKLQQFLTMAIGIGY